MRHSLGNLHDINCLGNVGAAVAYVDTHPDVPVLLADKI
jgi:hypothetical protein